MKEVEIEPSKELAYLLGVAQADGYLKRFLWKGEERIGLDFGVAEKSLPMLEKFRDLSDRVFGRKTSIWKDKKGVWRYHLSVKSLLQKFRDLQIIVSPVYLAPVWAVKEKSYFGAYLAGLIDGDGDVRIKRPKYPQCVIRITSGLVQDFLQKQLEALLTVKVSQTRMSGKRVIKGKIVDSKWVSLEFYVSKRVYQFLLKYVIPQMVLSYKKDKLLQFIN